MKFELGSDIKARFEVQCRRAGYSMAEMMRMLVECFTTENELEDLHKN
jgi:hypothetical protein